MCDKGVQTYGQPLRVVGFGGSEEGVERVVCGEGKASGIDQELAGNVKEDEEEVEGGDAQHHVDFGDAGLLLEVVQGWVFGELLCAADVRSVLAEGCRGARGAFTHCRAGSSGIGLAVGVVSIGVAGEFLVGKPGS